MKKRANRPSCWRTWRLLSAAAVLLAGCNATLSAFVLPASTWAGHDFLVVVVGFASGPNPTTGDRAGCVLQVPLGFTIVGRGPGLADEQALLQLYTPEPGHYLVSQSGTCMASEVSTHFVVRAPTALGAFTFKASIAGYAGTSAFQPVDPPSVTSFAQITAANYVRQTTVQATTNDLFTLGATLPTSAQKCLFVDLDHDGMDDLVTRPGNTWLNRSPLPSGSTLDEVAVGDFDGDGNLDLVHASRTVYFGDGQGNWTAMPLLPATNTAVKSLGAGDFDRDGRDDILECDATGWWRCFHSEPGRTFRSLSYGLPASGTAQTQLSFADLDGDGALDIVGTSGAYSGNGLGAWSLLTGLPFSCARRVVADVFGDSRPEILLVPAGANGAISILSTSNGTSWVTTFPPYGPSINSVYGDLLVADFDGDGTKEVVLGGVGLEVWRYVGNACLQVAATGLPPHLATSSGSGFGLSPTVGRLSSADLDGDGRRELIATSYLAGDWGPLVWRNLKTGAVPYGAACTAPGFGTPSLAAVGLPQVGNAAFALDLHGGQANGFGLQWLGTSRSSRFGGVALPLTLASFGAPGCSLLAEDLATRFVVFSPGGSAAVPFPLPNDPSLRYFSVYGQGAALAVGANALGLLTSNGLSIRID